MHPILSNIQLNFSFRFILNYKAKRKIAKKKLPAVKVWKNDHWKLEEHADQIGDGHGDDEHIQRRYLVRHEENVEQCCIGRYAEYINKHVIETDEFEGETADWIVF